MPNFFDLPRELRDQIYGLNLVHGTIPIGTSEKFLYPSYGQLRHVDINARERRVLCWCDICSTARKMPRITRHNTQRTARHFYLKSSYLLEDTTGKRIEELQGSYGQPKITDSGFASGFRENLTKLDSRSLIIFLVNRQIYYEASTVFYSHNKFDFGYRDTYHGYSESLPNALGFLLDRPKQALASLKSLRLALGTSPIDTPSQRACQEEQVLRTLCDKLGNECQLNQLEVGVFGYSFSPHACSDQLYKIKGLRDLKIWVQGRNEHGAHLESSVAFVKNLRSRLLIGRGERGSDGIDIVQHVSPSGYEVFRVSTWKPERSDDSF